MDELREYSAKATLRDGTAVRLRAVRPDDKAAFQEGFRRLSPETIYHRFFQAKRNLTDAELKYLTEVDFRDHVALVAELDQELVTPSGRHTPGDIVGVGRFVRPLQQHGSATAEVAFTVADEVQGRGVATQLLWHLSKLARSLGIATFVAEVMPDNKAMLEVFENSGFKPAERVVDGVVRVTIPLGD